MKDIRLLAVLALLGLTVQPFSSLAAAQDKTASPAVNPDGRTQVFLIGDSTMADKPLEENPERGWGQAFPDYLDREVVVRNHAVNGRSTKSFINERRWEAVLGQLRPGDWVFIQFGHNDEKINDPTRYAAPRSAYRENLTRFVQEARGKGAHSVLLTPVMRRKFDAAGKFVDTHGEYPDAVRETARALGVPLIDLHRKSQALIERHGVEGSKILFLWIDPGHFKTLPDGKKDDTHFSAYGAAQIAALVAEGMRELNLPLGKHLLPSPFTGKYEYELPKVYRPHFRQAVFPVTEYGAKGDGLTPNTTAFNAAIKACHKAGGGVVTVPRGVWLTGPLVLRSNVNLHLERGALVTFSDKFDDYPLKATSFEGVGAYRAQSPISADGAENVGITGEGILDGAGDRWRPVKKSKVTEAEWKRLTRTGAVNKAGDIWYPSAKALKGSLASRPGVIVPGKGEKDYEEIKDFLRPNMVQFARCRHLLIEGVTFQNSPAWTLHFLLSEHVTLKNVKVKNPWHGQNTDGVDLDSTRNVLIEGCVIDTGDDAVCLKSGRDEEGRRRGVPTENVLVRDCTIYHGHGGFVIGSEMSGGVRNVFVSDSTFVGTDIGLRFKTTRGRGGVVEQVYAANLGMKEIGDAAVFFDMYYGGQEPSAAATEKAGAPKPQPATEGTPQFRDFFIRNIVCRGAKRGIFVRGLPEMNVRGVRMENLVVQSEEGVYLEEATDVVLTKVAVYSEKTSPVVTVRNAKRVTLDRFDFSRGAELLVLVAGDRAKEIVLPGTEVSQARAGLRFTEGASPAALR